MRRMGRATLPAVIRGRVLVIEGDEWIAPVLVRALRDKGFEVELCGDARSGFAKACEMAPDCVVAGFELPDIDGYWAVRRIRTESSKVSRTPIVMYGEITEADMRAQAFAAGADVVLARPLTNDDVVAQVEALVAMARRYDDENPPSSTSMAAAIRGDLSMFPLASVLMMFEMERRSGTVEIISSGGTKALLTIAHGLFASTELGGAEKPAIEVLRQVLSWRAGRFAFQSRDPDVMPPPRESVGALVLEAMRLEDEVKNGDEAPGGAAKAADPFASEPPPPRKSIAPKRGSVAPPKAKRNSVLPPAAHKPAAPKGSVKPPPVPRPAAPKTSTS
jgi:CheY-like chemotaxis protein